MPNKIFQEIEHLHSEWERMDNSAKLIWLTKEKMRLNGLTNQMAQYVSANGGFMNSAERAYACKLLDMLNSVDAEGAKVMNELANGTFKELVKSVLHI